jgi:hypothetical protein
MAKTTARASIMAALALAMVASGGVVGPADKLPARSPGKRRTPSLPRQDTALAREIAEWNAAVDARKAKKKEAGNG